MTFSEANAEEPKTKILFISKKSFSEIVGKDLEKVLRDEALSSKMKGKRTEFKLPAYEEPTFTSLPKLTTFTSFSLRHPITLVGEFGFVGNFTRNSGPCSVKVIWKERAYSNRRAEALLIERNILAAATVSRSAARELLPRVEASFQDEKVAYLIFSDLFVCDLVRLYPLLAIDI